MPAALRPQVVHQCGAAHLAEARARYRAAAVDAEVVPFIDEIAVRYAWADVALCRAGAITASELSTAGVAAILVPLVVSTTDHQRTNAEFLARHGAAIHLPQPTADASTLAALLGGLTREQLLAIAVAARALGRADATALVAGAIERIAAASPLAADGSAR
jgi:UDP-N-acetylglucosamine--N-acetylmuramyl-(pentapeptide) pyrophosphoryl-undecaprenol N-acetylglucosamine transferase